MNEVQLKDRNLTQTSLDPPMDSHQSSNIFLLFSLDSQMISSHNYFVNSAT